MSTDQKIIKNRVGLLELAKQLGNVSQACNILGYSRDSFYRYKEGVVVAIARPTHALLHAVSSEDASVFLGRVLTAAVSVMNQSRGRLALSDGELQCLDYQRSFHAHVERPTHDLSRKQIHEHGQICELVLQRYVGDVADPNLVQPIHLDAFKQQVRAVA